MYRRKRELVGCVKTIALYNTSGVGTIPSYHTVSYGCYWPVLIKWMLCCVLMYLDSQVTRCFAINLYVRSRDLKNVVFVFIVEKYVILYFL